MKIWTVVSRAMNVVDVYALFTSRDKAEQFLKEKDDIPFGSVEEWPIHGEYKHPDTLYIANKLLPREDITYTVGIYTDYDEALKATEGHLDIRGVVPDDLIKA